MKKLFTLLTLVLLTATIQLSAQDLPKTGFTVTMPETKLYLKPGQEKAFDVNINRSKRFQNTDVALSLSSETPEGLQVSFQIADDKSLPSKMIIRVDENLTNYRGTYILNGSAKSITKGTMFTLSVEDDVQLPAGQ